jgi:hypothetical protein
MEQIIDEQGRIVRSPAALAALIAQVEQQLGSQVGGLAIEEQIWSSSGAVHMGGLWRASETPLLIKLGVNRNQLYWSEQIAATAPALLPHLYASGERIGELPISWVALERIAYGPLGPAWGGEEFTMLLDAAVRFQRAARAVEPRHTQRMDAALLRRWLAVGVAAQPPGPVDSVMDTLDADWSWLAAACGLEVCHGDIHMCNILTRTAPPDSSEGLLIDCQPIIQPWAFDAAYPQILNSTDRARVGYRELVPKMARIRAAYGLPSCAAADLERVARLALAWFAIRLWGLTPDRHSIADYRAETERYISEGAA